MQLQPFLFHVFNTYATVFTFLAQLSGADPGFPVGGAWTHFGGRGPPMWVLFGENVCQNERIGSHGGCAPENLVCRSANGCQRQWCLYNWYVVTVTCYKLSMSLTLIIHNANKINAWLAHCTPKY